jgi:PAS domain S-box-containing protein
MNNKAPVEAIPDSELRYLSLFDNMLNGLAYCRMIFEGDRPRDFVYLAVNKAFETQTGLKDVVGRKVSEVIPGLREADPQLFEIYGRVARSGTAEKFETYVTALRQWFEISVYSPSRDHFVAVFDVITKRKEAETDLAFSERKFSAAFHSSPDPMVISDGATNLIVDVNKAFESFLGFPRQEVIGRGVAELHSWVDPSRRERLLAKLKADGEVRNFPADIRTKAGAIRQVLFSGSVIEVAGKRYILNQARDITDALRSEQERTRLLDSERAARAQAEAASRTKDEFLALVSHELRTPMTSILGWSWLLRSGDLSPAERKSALQVIERNMQAEKQIIDDILDVSSLTRGQLSLQKQTLDLGKLLADIAAGFAAEFQAKSVRLVCEPAAGLLVEGDPRRVRQIFWNLLSNAAKFTPEGGAVTVLARRAQGNALVSVEDTGPGMSAEFYSKVFELFGQQEPALTRIHGGLGLGLAIVKHLVALHGGTVSVAAPVPGRGVNIAVSLPLSAPAKASAPSELTGPAAEAGALPHFSKSLSGMRLLVVDDDDGTRKMLLAVLEHFGASVQGAASAAEGFAAFARARPDVLISDIAMPGEDGYSLIGRIRALRPEQGSEVPAAALTAYGSAEDRAKALRAGFQIHLPKPVDPPELVTVVRSLSRKTGAKAA